MPLENLEEEGLPKNPDLKIAQLKFLLTLDDHRQDAEVKSELMEAIRANSESTHQLHVQQAEIHLNLYRSSRVSGFQRSAA